MADQTLQATVADMLSRSPDYGWVEDDSALFGWGVLHRFEPGSGVDRYRVVADSLAESGSPLAFASFTFDVEQPGSVAVVPELIVRVTSAGIETLLGSDLPPSRAGWSRPELVAANGSSGDWNRTFQAAMASLEDGDLEKVVISREISLQFTELVQPSAVLADLVAMQTASFAFCVDGLVGSSPELLAHLENGLITSIALAGSGEESSELETEKMAREHDLTAESVADALLPHCIRLERSQRRIARFADIAHLATTFTGAVRPGVSVLDLIADLHPTAAVAGTPTKKAVEVIREVERYPRGRYSGPVGWFDDHGQGAFAIALRCGLVEDRNVRLYTGAGLVNGSDQEEELAETDLKLIPMRRALGLT